VDAARYALAHRLETAVGGHSHLRLEGVRLLLARVEGLLAAKASGG